MGFRNSRIIDIAWDLQITPADQDWSIDATYIGPSNAWNFNNGTQNANNKD